MKIAIMVVALFVVGCQQTVGGDWFRSQGIVVCVDTSAPTYGRKYRFDTKDKRTTATTGKMGNFTFYDLDLKRMIVMTFHTHPAHYCEVTDE